ncbi:MAG: ferredoxin [Mollicutes bacterium]|jgi:ferredoxin|nr:ferredoxin [Mollicutes bacterium]
MKKVEINKDNCISCGLCINTAENTFAWDDDGKSKVINNEVTDEVTNIAEMCPTGAIVITEKNE